MHARRGADLAQWQSSMDRLLAFARQRNDANTPLHLIVLLRNPVDRAFSSFCMFAPSSRKIVTALHTRSKCATRGEDGQLGIRDECAHAEIKQARCTSAVCTEDDGLGLASNPDPDPDGFLTSAPTPTPTPGTRWSYNTSCRPLLAPKCRLPGSRSKGLLWDDFHKAIPSFKRQLPAALSGSAVNRSWLYSWLASERRVVSKKEGVVTDVGTNEQKALLKRLVLPWVDPGCSDNGWGWARRTPSHTRTRRGS